MSLENFIFEIEENAYIYHLRQYLEWDDEMYLKEIVEVKRQINSYKNEKIIPKILVFYFCIEIENIVGIISNPAFIKNLNEIEIARINDRKLELLGLRERFFRGDLFAEWE